MVTGHDTVGNNQETDDSSDDSSSDTSNDSSGDLITNIIDGSDESDNEDENDISFVPPLRTLTRHGCIAGIWQRNFQPSADSSDV